MLHRHASVEHAGICKLLFGITVLFRQQIGARHSGGVSPEGASF